eukprot:2605753-Rhodomonas_salina.1
MCDACRRTLVLRVSSYGRAMCIVLRMHSAYRPTDKLCVPAYRDMLCEISCVRIFYAMSGTVLRICQACSSTDRLCAYWPTDVIFMSCYGHAMQCPVVRRLCCYQARRGGLRERGDQVSARYPAKSKTNNHFCTTRSCAHHDNVKIVLPRTCANRRMRAAKSKQMPCVPGTRCIGNAMYCI